MNPDIYEIYIEGWNPLPLEVINLIPKAMPDNMNQCFNYIDPHNNMRSCYNGGHKFDRRTGYIGKKPGNPHNYYICPECKKKYKDSNSILFRKFY